MQDYNEFYEELWSKIPASIVSEEFVLNNKQFINSITFEAYRICDMDGNMSVNIMRKILII